MNKLNETIYATGIASSLHLKETKMETLSMTIYWQMFVSNMFQKKHMKLEDYAQDLAGGGFVKSSGIDIHESDMSPNLKKYLKGKEDINTELKIVSKC